MEIILNINDIDRHETTHDASVSLVRLIQNQQIEARLGNFNYAWLNPGEQFNEHKHDDSIEFFLILAGYGLLHSEETTYEIREGDFIRINPREFHSIENTSLGILTFITLRVIVEK